MSYRELCSDWLRAGRYRDRIPVKARFSAPVQTGSGAHPASCTMSRAIHLLPLWTVQPVQSLSACTTVQFTFTSPQSYMRSIVDRNVVIRRMAIVTSIAFSPHDLLTFREIFSIKSDHFRTRQSVAGPSNRDRMSLCPRNCNFYVPCYRVT